MCVSNCPYTVRYFNWFAPSWPEEYKKGLNPDVYPRRKGITEKCNFCIQRIRTAKMRAKKEKRKIRDGEVIPACAETCPSEAILFGDLNDPKSQVSRLSRDEPSCFSRNWERSRRFFISKKGNGMTDSEAIAQKYGRVLNPLTQISRLYLIVASLLAGIVFWSFFAFGYQYFWGLGKTGMGHPVSGPYLVNFVFFIGISHGGLVSAVLDYPCPMGDALR
jgi:ferredoxin